MSSVELLNKAGFKLEKEGPGVYQWRVGAGITPRIRRFNAFGHETLCSTKNSADLLPALMVVLDGIPPSALKSIRKQAATPFQMHQVVLLEWDEVNPPRTERREISPLTTRAWVQATQDRDSTSDAELPDLEMSLRKFLYQSTSYGERKDPIQELELDALCWWYQCLPAPLFAHLARLQTLSALPRSALAREVTQLAMVASDGIQDDPADACDLGLTAECLNGVTQSDGDDRSTNALRMALDALVITKNEVDGVTKRKWGQALHHLRPQAERTGPITCLLLAWGLDLIENGTVGERNLATTTIKPYFSAACMPLFAALKLILNHETEIQEWSPELLRITYMALIEAKAPGSQKTMASALTSFHSFMCEWFDLPQVHFRLHNQVPQARVQAQTIWPHEFALVMSWITQVDDIRVRDTAQFILSLAYEAPARTNELLRLRLRNFSLGHDAHGRYMEVEIAPSARLGRLKTSAAQRRLTIREQSTITLVQAYIARRHAEGAPPSALIFGSPSDDSTPYRGAAVISLLNRLLKAATGEQEVRIHTLRHGSVSARMARDLSGASVPDVNRHSITATEAGHASAMTTLTTYFHRYESTLRTTLDTALNRLVPLTGDQASLHLGIGSSALRKQAQRKGIPLNDYCWKCIRELPVTSTLPIVSAPFGWRIPCAPPLLPHQVQEFTPHTTLQWLESLSNGNPANLENLAAKYGVPEQRLQALSEYFQEFCFQCATHGWPRTKFEHPKTVSAALKIADIDLVSTRQNKFTNLANFLSERPPLSLLQAALTGWQSCQFRGYLSVTNTEAILALYELLSASKVGPEYLAICIEKQSVQMDTDRLRVLVCKPFEAVFGMKPHIFPRDPHDGRPSAYLQWSATKIDKDQKTVHGSCGGLDSWMCAVAAYLQFTGGEK
jgi:integrase